MVGSCRQEMMGNDCVLETLSGRGEEGHAKMNVNW